MTQFCPRVYIYIYNVYVLRFNIHGEIYDNPIAFIVRWHGVCMGYANEQIDIYINTDEHPLPPRQMDE